MRRIAQLPEEQASRFSDYLLTLNIGSRVDPPIPDEGSNIWIRREEQVSQAREELKAFLNAPDDPQYLDAPRKAAAIRREEARTERQYASRTVDLRLQMNRPMAGLGNLSFALIVICVGFFLIDSLAGRSLQHWLFFTDWYRNGTDAGFGLIFGGQVWRLITPIFVHGNLLHLFFNMYMLARFGTLIERNRPASEYLALIAFTAVVSNCAQYALPDLFTYPPNRTGGGPFGGMSGVLYGLLGYAWVRTQYDPSSSLRIPQSTVVFLLIWMVFCFFEPTGGIANTAHVAGLVAGGGFGLGALWIERQRQ